jgi:hypothetical protein
VQYILINLPNRFKTCFKELYWCITPKNFEDAVQRPVRGLWPITTAMMRFIQSYFLELVSNIGFIRK